MHDSETRALRRTAVRLLAVSVLRWALPGGSVTPDINQVTDSLLVASQEGLAEAERRARPLEPGERIDPNLATAQELDRLPGIGSVAAEAIVAERGRSGPFRDADDLSRVRGIGPATVAKLEGHISVATSRPVSRAWSHRR
jgi:competence protein ComEA